MGSSSSKSPEEYYTHIVAASASLFKSVANHWEKNKSDNESKFVNFFAEFRQCFEMGDLVLNQEMHVKHAGIEDSRMDFIEYIITKKVPALSKSAAEVLQEYFNHFYKRMESKVRPEIVRSRIIAAWILHDDNCSGELQLVILKNEVIGKMDFDDRFKGVILRRLETIPRRILHATSSSSSSAGPSPSASTAGSGGGISPSGRRRSPSGSVVAAEDADYIPYFILSEILDNIALFRELDVYWKMNFETEKEALVRGNFLTPFEFGKFLRGNQLEAGNVQHIQKLAEDLAATYGGTLDRHSFVRFLTDPEMNPAVDYQKYNSVYHDMSHHPLPNYFVSASFKTYLVDPGVAHVGASSLASAIIHHQHSSSSSGGRVGVFADAKCSADRYRQVLTGEGFVLYPGEEKNNTTTKQNEKSVPFITNPSASLVKTKFSESNPEDHSVARFVDVDVWLNPLQIKEKISLGAGVQERVADFVVGPDESCKTNIPLSEVLTTIRDSAFTKSPYPIMISIGFPNNLSLEKQRMLADQIKRGLNSDSSSNKNGNIFCPRTDEDNPLIEPNEWTPEALKRMFILAGRSNISSAKKSSASSNSGAVYGNQTTKIHIMNRSSKEDLSTASSSENNSNNNANNVEGAVAPELENLFFLHHFLNPDLNELAGTAHDRDHEAPKNFKNDAMSRCALRTISDDNATAFSITHPRSVAQVGYSNFIRVVPSGDKWRKMQNFSPHALWEAGAQIVSLFWWKPGASGASSSSSAHSTAAALQQQANNANTIHDEAIRLYRNRFADNGRCGYLLRPDSLLKSRLPASFFPTPNPSSPTSEVPSSPTSKAKLSFSTKYPQHQRFMFSVLSAFCLPQPKSKLFENEKVNPFVIIKIEGPGHAPNRVLMRTGSVRDNAFHPSFVNLLPERTALEKFKHDMETKGMVEMVIADGSNNKNKNNKGTNNSTSNPSTPQQVTPRQHQHHRKDVDVESYEQHSTEFPPHCSTELEVFIPEMSQLVIQIYHDRKGFIDRIHNSDNPEAMQLDDNTGGEGRTDLDKYQLQSRGQLQDVLLAEAVLPIHLLNRGVRCVRLRCLESGSTNSLLMVKIGALKDPFTVAEEEKEKERLAQAQQEQSERKKSSSSKHVKIGGATTTGGGELRSELSLLLSGAGNPKYNQNNDLNGDDDDTDHHHHGGGGGIPMSKDMTMEFSL